jgi:predicted ATPase
MRISGIHLRNFRRFTDLRIRDIPDTAKLVAIVGPNGCGKSSLFDALLVWYRDYAGFGIHPDDAYYKKDVSEAFNWRQNVEVAAVGGTKPHRGCLYVRTAYRNDPDFAVSNLTKQAAPSEQIRFSRFIDNDATVSENYQRLLYDTMTAIYSKENDAKSVVNLRGELIGRIQNSMKAVFGDLQLKAVSDPLGEGSFYFEKGTAKGYHYKNLSGGEKAAFDLLLDVHIKAKFFHDAVYCIDEMETHLHTRVQGALLKEMINILPDNCQLWVTTHSLGMLRAAQEIEIGRPGSVAVIDFDDVDPDVPREISPSNLDRVSWEKMLSIALDDLSPRLAPEIIVVCEGSKCGGRRKDFDAEIYNRILGSSVPGIVFISGGSSNQVAATGVSVSQTLKDLALSTQVVSLCDRDDKSDAEVADFERGGNLVLPLRNIESYLFADDVIEALLTDVDKIELLPDALRLRSRAIEASVERGNPRDDFKSAAGDIYTGLKQLLDLRQAGNNTDVFMRDTLARLIKSPMPTFVALRAAVLDRLYYGGSG